MKRIKTVLHPTDFTPSAMAALTLACAVARDQKARLLILHVVPGVDPAVGGGDVAALQKTETRQQDLKAYQEEMRQKLSKIQLPEPQPAAERLVKEGEVASVIVRLAQETPCDAIIMGTRARPEPERHALGSVAETIVRKAPCMVVTVNAPAS
jgi:nucleotide-binding universal stress UspA family protein